MSREKVLALLAKRDRSSLVLSKYVPARSLDGWLALRGVNVETAKIADTVEDPKLALTQLEYWREAVTRVQRISQIELRRYPASLALLGKAIGVDKAAIHQRYLITMVQSRERQVLQPPINTIEDLAYIGEGTTSQILYATLDMLQNRESGTVEFLHEHVELDEKVSEILAHIGQASGIAQSLRALSFYVRKRNRLLLPNDVLSQHNLSSQAAIDVFTKNNDTATDLNALKDVVFDIATAANDHILTARQKMQHFRDTVGKTPPSLNLTTMAAIPTVLYLERLQKNDFDLRRNVTEWKLPWRSWRGQSGNF